MLSVGSTIQLPDAVSTRWTNFAGDQSCTPAGFERPADRDQVAAAIGRAAALNRTVRVAGAGHSFTDAVLTDGVLLSLERMDHVLDIDRETGLVRVEAGITLGALSEVLWDAGLGFANLGDIDVQSLAGAAATGTHGTGAALGNISTALHSVELTLADGSTLEVRAETDSEAWRAARISIGALGVVTAVTLQAVPAFTLDSIESNAPIESTLEDLDELVAENDHFGFFTFPHSDLAMTKVSNRVDAAPRPRPRPVEFFEEVLVTNYAYWGICALGRAQTRLIPALNRLCSRLSGTTRRRDRSYRIFRTPRRVPITEMEYAIPRAHAAEAVRAVRAVAERAQFDVPVPIEVRFVAADDAFLSPAGGRDSCYVAVHQFHGMAWEPYFRAVEDVMVGFDGRPHWGKRHFQTAETLSESYPEWGRFAAVRERLDPEGRFANDYVNRVLGPLA